MDDQDLWGGWQPDTAPDNPNRWYRETTDGTTVVNLDLENDNRWHVHVFIAGPDPEHEIRVQWTADPGTDLDSAKLYASAFAAGALEGDARARRRAS